MLRLCNSISNATKLIYLSNYSTINKNKLPVIKNAVFKRYSTKPNLRDLRTKNRNEEEIGPIGWFILLIPVSTFCLGVWQIRRKKWKEDLILDLKNRTQSNPIELPEDLTELKSLEYHPVIVKGHFDHSKELYIGPRSLIIDGDASTHSGLFSHGNKFGTSGYLVVTPFKLSDRDLTILVNRGWVPQRRKDPTTRLDAQVTCELTITGVLRLNEARPTFTPKNIPESNVWLYRDLSAMCEKTGAQPVFIEAITDCTIEGGPIGGQTRISLRNEHLSYIFTWFTLSGCTSWMWYRMFIQKLPLL